MSSSKGFCTTCALEYRGTWTTSDGGLCLRRWKEKHAFTGTGVECYVAAGCLYINDEQELEKETEILT